MDDRKSARAEGARANLDWFLPRRLAISRAFYLASSCRFTPAKFLRRSLPTKWRENIGEMEELLIRRVLITCLLVHWHTHILHTARFSTFWSHFFFNFIDEELSHRFAILRRNVAADNTLRELYFCVKNYGGVRKPSSWGKAFVSDEETHIFVRTQFFAREIARSIRTREHSDRGKCVVDIHRINTLYFQISFFFQYFSITLTDIALTFFYPHVEGLLESFSTRLSARRKDCNVILSQEKI